MRDQRRKEWTGELPSGTELTLVLPDVKISRKALSEVPSAKADHLLAATEIAVQNQLKMCLQSVGGESVSPRDMRYGGLDQYFGPQEQQIIKELLQKLTRPSEAEMAYFRESLVHVREDGDWRWTGRMLTGQAFADLQDAEEALEEQRYKRRRIEQELEESSSEDGVSLSDEEEEELVEKLHDRESRVRELEDRVAELEGSALEVSGELPGSKIVRRAKEQVPEDATPALAAKEFQENLLRNAVDQIDEQEVSYGQLRGTKLDDWFSPKEQHILITALSDEMTPNDEETQGFLETVQMG